MPKSYSDDLRWRAVWLFTIRGMTYSEIADVLYMSERSVRRYIEQYMTTGGVEAAEQRHGPTVLLNNFQQLTVLQSLVNKPTIYLDELRKEFYDSTGAWVSLATTCRTVHRLGFTRKKVQQIALQRSDELRARFMADVSLFYPQILVWVDETGSDRRSSIRSYGYSLRGVCACNQQLRIAGKRINAIGIMSRAGVEDVYITEENVDGDVFEDFVRTTLLPLLMPFNGVNSHSVVIMDNASIHHMEKIRDD